MTKFTITAIVIALSATATAALAQTPSPNSSLVATPSASDPATRDRVMATLKAAMNNKQNGDSKLAASAANSASVAMAMPAARAAAARR